MFDFGGLRRDELNRSGFENYSYAGCISGQRDTQYVVERVPNKLYGLATGLGTHAITTRNIRLHSCVLYASYAFVLSLLPLICVRACITARDCVMAVMSFNIDRRIIETAH